MKKSKEGLSDREVEILKLLSDGLTYEETGGELHITAKTVENHADRIRRKYGNIKLILIVKLAAISGLLS